jgi:hypothetical protein
MRGGRTYAIEQHNVDPKKLQITIILGRYIPTAQHDAKISIEEINARNFVYSLSAKLLNISIATHKTKPTN